MKTKNVPLTLAAILTSCVISQQAGVSNATNSIQFSSKLHVGRVEAKKNSTLQLGSMKLQGSNLGSTLCVKTSTRIGGSVMLKKSAQLRIASFDLDNARIGSNTNLDMNVQVQKRIEGDEESEIDIGGVQIIADDNYNPQNFRNKQEQLTPTWQNQSNPLRQAKLQQNSFYYTNSNSYKNDWGYQMIELSKCSYRDKHCTMTNNWEVINPSSIGIRKELFENEKTGFHARLFRNKNTKEYVLGFEGTNEGKDWQYGNFQASGILTAQYQNATELSYIVNKQVGKNGLTFTGHSLGGGLASMASMITGQEAVTFNSAGINVLSVHDAVRRYSFDNDEKNRILENWENRNKQVTAYHNKGDILTQAQWLTLGFDNAIGERISLPNPPGLYEHGIDEVRKAYKLYLQKDNRG